MMIDYTFFRDGLLMVDGALALASPSPINDAIGSRIESFIQRYEPEYLRKLLGEELYNDFLANGNWDELKEILVDDSAKVSPVANYVYFHMVRHSQSTATINGVKNDGDSNLVNPTQKMVWAWNDMVKQNRRIYMLLCKNYPVVTDEELLEPINTFNI